MYYSWQVRIQNKVVFQKNIPFGPKRGEFYFFEFSGQFCPKCQINCFSNDFGNLWWPTLFFRDRSFFGRENKEINTKTSKSRVFSQFFPRMTKIWPILKFFCLLVFYYNKFQKQVSKTFLKQTKTIVYSQKLQLSVEIQSCFWILFGMLKEYGIT